LILSDQQDTLWLVKINAEKGRMKTRVIIADDHAIIREGLKSLFEKKGMDVIAIAKNGREAVEFAIKFQPDIVMMDISMPDLNGVEATAVIRKEVPRTKVIALSMHANKIIIDKMISSGVSGYVLKETAFDELYDAVLDVKKGKFYLSPSIAGMYCDTQGDLLKFDGDVTKFNTLSKKERHVLQLVAEGKKNKDIAETLGVTTKTIESHRRSIMKKLNIFSIAGLTKFAIQEGIVFLE